MPWQIIRLREFEADLDYWARIHSPFTEKILDLIISIQTNPRWGIGKPERLKHYFPEEVWSRRISSEHRLTYRIEGSCVYLLRARSHYQ